MRRAGPTGFSGQGGSRAGRSRGRSSAAPVPAGRAHAGAALTHPPPGPARRPRRPRGPRSRRAQAHGGEGAAAAALGPRRGPGRPTASAQVGPVGSREGPAAAALPCRPHFKGNLGGGEEGDKGKVKLEGGREAPAGFCFPNPVWLVPDSKEAPEPPGKPRRGGPHAAPSPSAPRKGAPRCRPRSPAHPATAPAWHACTHPHTRSPLSSAGGGGA